MFVHFYYKKLNKNAHRYRDLLSIFVLSLPHARLKGIYNPHPDKTFFGQGKHSPARKEAQRIRVYFSRLRKMRPWRLQELRYTKGDQYSSALWVENDPEAPQSFKYIGR